MSTLADRIRAVVGTAQPAPSPAPARPAAPSAVEAVLGGEWSDEGRCLVLDRSVAASLRHGCVDVGTCSTWIADSAGAADLFASAVPAEPRLVFFDLETTGLSGGAGTLAFLVGCGWFEDGAFRTKQFLMTNPAHERALLASVSRELGRANVLVSFNGKSFDAPLLEARCMYHRLPWPGDAAAHLDALHAARRFWKPRRIGTGRPGGDQPIGPYATPEPACSLVALERQVLRFRRRGDVPGLEIPARYFRFIRTGDAQPLAMVVEHNRLDLLTLAALTARLCHLAHGGPAQARDSGEAYALGVTYVRAGRDACARDCFARAIALSAAPPGAVDLVRLESLRALALVARRGRRFDEAAESWRAILEARGCPPAMRREAAEALAIHHEHRVRDLESARDFALRSLTDEPQAAWAEAVQYRLARIERKIGNRTGSGDVPWSASPFGER